MGNKVVKFQLKSGAQHTAFVQLYDGTKAWLFHTGSPAFHRSL